MVLCGFDRRLPIKYYRVVMIEWYGRLCVKRVPMYKYLRLQMPWFGDFGFSYLQSSSSVESHGCLASQTSPFWRPQTAQQDKSPVNWIIPCPTGQYLARSPSLPLCARAEIDMVVPFSLWHSSGSQAWSPLTYDLVVFRGSKGQVLNPLTSYLFIVTSQSA